MTCCYHCDMPSQRLDPPNFFSGPFIDRFAEDRADGALLEQARHDSATRYLVSVGGLHLLHDTQPQIAFLQSAHPLAQQASERDLVLLGRFDGAWCILIDLDPDSPAQLPPHTHLRELRSLAPELTAPDAALLTYARALTLWRMRQRFCGTCGAPTVPARAGHTLVCANPHTPHEIFPRIDPAIIVLVSSGDRVLLGRQPGWPPGRYSTIAGFVEPGESLEDAVAREVSEETGVGITACRYYSSQPWPFPSSLMLGFHADAGPDTTIRLGGELEDARWFSRADLISGNIQLPSGNVVQLPPPHAISHRLILSWLHQT